MGLTVLRAALAGTEVGLRAEEGVIVALGPEVVPEPGDEVLDALGMALVPPMVNAHTHAAMTLFRSFGDDMPLRTWLETRIWPAEARLRPDDVYWGTRLACLEMIRSGTARFFDMYWHAPEAARAVHDSGLRAVLAAPLIDTGNASGLAAFKDDALGSLERIRPFEATGRIVATLGPHAVYTVSRPSLEWLGELMAERGVGCQIHLSETRREVEDCVSETGLRPAELLHACGLLGPQTVVAHGCWLDPHELALLAETGTTVATVPVSNLKLAVGRHFPYLDALAAGVCLGLGTDGTASNNSLDLFQDVKVLSLVQKFAAEDPAVMPASEALAIARGQRSTHLGGCAIEPGAPADFLLVRLDMPEVSPGDLDANLVYAATGAVVDTTVVAGRVLMRERRVAGGEEILAEVRGRVGRLTGG
ncbi:amidohydrolase [Rhabdothermincola sediminis]|uniref:amidohydrolase n=1 Tax=Rhabdothermincola sediminis TaxID=2751370 RepID=UPI001AA03310|nr:amidohydrolase [Rhabdothermincola sediminis]